MLRSQSGNPQSSEKQVFPLLHYQCSTAACNSLRNNRKIYSFIRMWLNKDKFIIPCCRGGRYGWSLLAVLATFEYGNPKGPSHGFEGQWMYLRASKVNLNVVPLNRHVHLRRLSQHLVTQSWLLRTYGNKLHDHRLLVEYG